ncbi:hypothetical protein FB45DRAFT_942129, partial [Roridomyces roridus]
MSSESPTTKKKPSVPRKETPECRKYDMDLPRLFLYYFQHTQETSDAPTNRLLHRFDKAGQAGQKAFEDIAKLSKRLVDIDVALTSHRGTLLDTLDPLSSEYESLLDGVLRALASMGHYLLLCRAPLLPPGHSLGPPCNSCLPIVDIETLVADWERGLKGMKTCANAIENRWPDAISALRSELESLSLPLPSWLQWIYPENRDIFAL